MIGMLTAIVRYSEEIIGQFQYPEIYLRRRCLDQFCNDHCKFGFLHSLVDYFRFYSACRHRPGAGP